MSQAVLASTTTVAAHQQVLGSYSSEEAFIEDITARHENIILAAEQLVSATRSGISAGLTAATYSRLTKVIMDYEIYLSELRALGPVLAEAMAD